MTKILSIGIIFSAVLFIKCSKDSDADTTYECKNLPCITDTTKTGTIKTLKGHILFSWKNNSNGWNYSIVPNLNSKPAFDNVSTGNSFTGEVCLKMNLNYFADGEDIWWCGEGEIQIVDGNKVNLSFPPDNIVNDITDYCNQKKIELMIE